VTPWAAQRIWDNSDSPTAFVEKIRTDFLLLSASSTDMSPFKTGFGNWMFFSSGNIFIFATSA
jgi:hypothetical protein